MGIFGNYNKPGPGVTKEQARKRNYFEILGRHFWKMVQLNLLYVLVNILFIGASVFLAIPYLVGGGLEDLLVAILVNRQIVLLPIWPFLPLMLMGPFTAGLTYVIRNYAKQEHAFMASDFFEQSKLNWKQGLLASILSVLMLYLYLQALIFYNSIFFQNGISSGILMALALVIGILLLSMSFYIYPLMVTFKLKFTQILRNAWIFALAKLPQNLVILLIIGAVHFLLLWFLPIFVWPLLMVFILISWTSYTINYYVWHVMNKHMISLVTPAEELVEKEAVFDDELNKQ